MSSIVTSIESHPMNFSDSRALFNGRRIKPACTTFAHVRTNWSRPKASRRSLFLHRKSLLNLRLLLSPRVEVHLRRFQHFQRKSTEFSSRLAISGAAALVLGPSFPRGASVEFKHVTLPIWSWTVHLLAWRIFECHSPRRQMLPLSSLPKLPHSCSAVKLFLLRWS